jgi:hypothetical protein
MPFAARHRSALAAVAVCLGALLMMVAAPAAAMNEA